MDFARICARTAEREAQRPGERRLRPAGIGRGVLAGVAQRGAPRLLGIGALDPEGGAGEQQRRQPRRDPVGDVVEPGAGPAELGVALGAVPDHGVGGIDRLVEGDARQAAEQEPEQRRDDAVGGAFGQALDGGAGDPGLVQLLGIAADDLAHLLAPRLERMGERIGDGAHGAAEFLLRQERGGEHRLCHPAEGDEPQAPGDDDGDRRGGGKEDGQHQDALAPAIAAPVEAGLQHGDQPAHPDHRMADRLEQRRRIAEQPLQDEGQRGEEGVHQRISGVRASLSSASRSRWASRWAASASRVASTPAS